MATTKTTNLELRYIQPTDYFISDTFNNILDDIDSKVVGVPHLSSGAHWGVWKEQTDYVTGDIIRTPYLHSNQYLECSQSGKSGTIEPQVNVTGTKFTDGTAEWVVKVIGATDEKTVSIWLAGENYLRGSLVLYNNKLFRCKVPHQSIKFDTDYSKWQEVYASISPWESSKYYAVGDAVIKDNLLYECITANTDITFTEVNWKIVGSISIIEDWTKETDYKENQVIRYRDKLYRANTKHTSGATFNDSDWTEIFANIPEWKANEQYTVDNVVQKDNIMYICVNSHVSSVFADDIANWTIFHKPIANIPSWTQDTYYEVGQVVEKGGIIYRCKTTNSDSAFTEAKWEILVKAIVDWKSGDSYQVGQYVNYINSLYKCITPNNDSTFTASKWQKIGGSGLDEWKESTIYSVGDYAVYGNLIYKCVKAHTSTAKFIDDFGDGDWVEISASIPEWKASEQYIVGNVVEKGGIVYRCIISNADTTFTLSNWQKISSNGLGYWEANTAYTINDVVYYSGGYYVCITSHTSANDFQTDYDSTAPKWYRMDSHIDSYKNSTFYGKGVTVEYNNKIYKCLTSYTSTSEKMDKVGSAVSSATATSSAYTDSWNSGTSNKRLEVMNVSVFTVGTSHYMGTVAVYGNFNAGNHVFNVYGGSSSSNVNTLVKTFTFSPTSNLTNYSLEIPFEANFGYYAINVASATASGSTGNIAWYESSMNKWELIGEANEKVHALNKWVSGYSYEVNDVVRYANDYYVCLVAHTSSAFETNYESNYWYKMNSHLNNYTASTYYAKGSTIEFNNKIYKCITSHTSPASGDMAKGSTLSSSSAPTVAYTFEYGASVNNAIVEVYNVTTLASGGKKLGVFRVTCDLNAGTHKFAIYGGSSSNTSTHELVKEQTYTCSEYVASAKVDIDCEANLAYYHVKVVSATASGQINGISMFESTYPNWKLIGEPNERKAITDWKASTAYSVGDFVVYGNLIYKCINAHTSTSVFADDFGGGDWVEISACITHIDDWVAQRDYKIGDLVAYDAKIYRCIVNHKSTNDFLADLEDWEELSPTINQITNWGQGKKFDVGDLVMYDNVLYICNTVHTSGTTFDRTKFDAVGNLGTIPNWAKNTQYYKDQVVEYENTLYRAIDDHKSTNDNNGYFGSDDAHWELVYSNIQPYSNNTWYKTGSIVYQDGYLWRCKQNHKTNTDSVEERTFTISSDFRDYTLALGQEFTLHNIVLNTSYCGGVDISISTDGVIYTNLWHTDDAVNVENINCNSVHATHVKFTVLSVEPTSSTGASSGAYQGITGAVINTNNAYWEKLGITSEAITIWQANKQYNKDKAVFYQNKIYIAKENHLSSSTFELAKWKYIDPSLLVDWQAETDYYKDQLIYHENIVYRVTEDFTSGNTFADTKLERITRGYLATWGANTYYNLGECVVYKNSIIRCLTPHTSGTSYDATESTNWQIIANVSAVISKWNKKIDYQIGDVVTYGDILYSCITDHTSSENSFAEDIENWKVINAGIAKWESETNYAIGAVVTAINHKLYRCIIAHTSGTTNIIDDISNWEEISPTIYEWKADTDYFINDIVIYKNNLYRCIANHTSSATIDLDYFD